MTTGAAEINDSPNDTAGRNGTGWSHFPTWRAVYALVTASFLLWVGLLAALTRIYS